MSKMRIERLGKLDVAHRVADENLLPNGVDEEAADVERLLDSFGDLVGILCRHGLGDRYDRHGHRLKPGAVLLGILGNQKKPRVDRDDDCAGDIDQSIDRLLEFGIIEIEPNLVFPLEIEIKRDGQAKGLGDLLVYLAHGAAQAEACRLVLGPEFDRRLERPGLRNHCFEGI